MKKPIFFIINPSAGKEEPIIESIRIIFEDFGEQITIHELNEEDDPAAIARKAAASGAMVAVYGGDGSVTKTAAGLIGNAAPLAIIPGGTANVMSKELGIPQDTKAALQLIHDGNYRLRKIDTGLINGCPFLLRVNLGIMAEMITETDLKLKEKVGQLAYGVSTIKSIRDAEQVNYELMIDGEIISAAGVSLTITNSGSMGIGGLQLQPDIRVDDGLLDIVLLKSADVLSIVKAAGGSLFGLETDVVAHWMCKKVRIKLADRQLYLCDDCEAEAEELNISVVPSSLTVAVPLTD